MMRRIGILVALAAIVLVPAASAKEITKVTACGADGCVTTRDPAILQGLMNGGPPTVPPNANGRVIRLRATVSEPGVGAVGRFTSWWVPTQRLLVSEDGTWMPLSDAAARSLQRLTRTLAPLPASRMGISATVATPAASQRVSPDADNGTPSWLLIALPVAVVLAGGAVLVSRRRHRSSPSAPSPATL